jgi:hypothetical protein
MIDELPFTIVRSNGTGEVSDRVPLPASAAHQRPFRRPLFRACAEVSGRHGGALSQMA